MKYKKLLLTVLCGSQALAMQPIAERKIADAALKNFSALTKYKRDKWANDPRKSQDFLNDLLERSKDHNLGLKAIIEKMRAGVDSKLKHYETKKQNNTINYKELSYSGCLATATVGLCVGAYYYYTKVHTDSAAARKELEKMKIDPYRSRTGDSLYPNYGEKKLNLNEHEEKKAFELLAAYSKAYDSALSLLLPLAPMMGLFSLTSSLVYLKSGLYDKLYPKFEQKAAAWNQLKLALESYKVE